jgi:hypothetical protein
LLRSSGGPAGVMPSAYDAQADPCTLPCLMFLRTLWCICFG